MNISKLFTVGAAASAVGALALLSACGGSANAKEAAPPATQVINYTAVAADDGVAGPDGATHDTFTTADSTTIKLGTRVTLNFTNKDDAQHSFTLPELGINVVLPAAKDDNTPGVTSYTFTATKAGTYRWFCAIPCDSDNNGWAMTASAKGSDQDSFMAGYLTVAS